ncbi:hypothetical protein GYO_3169 [Bacillus spizizenii TU-B-10]|uniref:Uncharacterized protein n=1 Tax=Bacillus spizizenii (strain DSM 15029 / JCM 12233 / NBRC 101239 / NRRL B-23049 / TU-B-10) TaxID=1052585 RepID=G4NZ74_BACS4|nr:hypothetical protein GYO_3169 [Bacillus spizizenii TU-B-10]SCV43190.1 hypothetical protein BQ1740_3430 [Bacillus subtilis]
MAERDVEEQADHHQIKNGSHATWAAVLFLLNSNVGPYFL